jgi:hypothetical protein
VLLHADTQDARFHKYEHVVLRCVTGAVLFLHHRNLPCKFLSISN